MSRSPEVGVRDGFISYALEVLWHCLRVPLSMCITLGQDHVCIGVGAVSREHP